MTNRAGEGSEPIVPGLELNEENRKHSTAVTSGGKHTWANIALAFPEPCPVPLPFTELLWALQSLLLPELPGLCTLGVLQLPPHFAC